MSVNYVSRSRRKLNLVKKNQGQKGKEGLPKIMHRMLDNVVNVMACIRVHRVTELPVAELQLTQKCVQATAYLLQL